MFTAKKVLCLVCLFFRIHRVPRIFVRSTTLCFLLALSFLTILPQNAPIVVSADQPNVWTLEQAHYLLAQMHRRNLDLKAKPFDNEGLDASEINGLNVDVLKTLLSVSAEFDQAVAKNNSIIQGTKQYQIDRQRNLVMRRDNLRDESLALIRKIAELRIAHAKEKDEAEKAKLQAQIDELVVVKTAVDDQAQLLRAEIDEYNKDTTSTNPFKSVFNNEETGNNNKPEASDVANSLLESSVKKIIDTFNNEPKLNASLRLDNYLQLQYEILSKQLTLLRDEVGAGERLIFLEVPQSINSSHKIANNMWAQSWWQIAAFSQCIAYKNEGTVIPCSKVFEKDSNQIDSLKLTTNDIIDNFHKDSTTELNAYKDTLILNEEDVRYELFYDFFFNRYKFERKPFVRELQTQIFAQLNNEINAYNTKSNDYDDCSKANPNDYSRCNDQRNSVQLSRDQLQQRFVEKLNDFVDNRIQVSRNSWLSISTRVTASVKDIPTSERLFRRIALEDALGIKLPISNVQHKKAANNALRVVDLFPRQSSLNINDIKLRNSSFSFKFLFDFLWGFGASANYQRTREKYSQFVQQELYSSAFGKGSREFGWTFYPMPGTDRVSSGVRTTYAILVVPEDTTAIELKSTGCYFARSSTQPPKFSPNTRLEKGACTEEKVFIVPIPDGGTMNNNDFYVTGVTYQPVPKGNRAVVTIYGRNFSSQIGVLINGVPLKQALGLGQPFIIDDSQVKSTNGSATDGVDGSFERVDSKQLILSFKMSAEYEKTPTITIIAPGKAVDLNSLEIVRNPNGYGLIKLADAPWIFGTKPEINGRTVTLNQINAFLAGNSTKIIITGTNLDLVKKVFVNGRSADPTSAPNTRDKSLIEIQIPSVSENTPSLYTTYLTDEIAINGNPTNNPAYRAEKPDPEEIPYEFDDTKFEIDEISTYRKCTKKSDTVTAFYQIKVKGLSQWSNVLIDDKIYPFQRRSTDLIRIKLVNPKPEQEIEIRDRRVRLKDGRTITFEEPDGGCTTISN